MPIHIPGMRRMARQQRPCICRSISWPSCRWASYLLNETVPTDLDNRTLASAPRSLHWELCCITESPCARAKQHRQPWTPQWVDMRSHIIGSFRCCLYFSLNAADDFFFFFFAPLIIDMTVTQDYEWYTRESRFISHSPTYHLNGCVAAIPIAVDSFQSRSALLPCDLPGNEAGWNASCSSDSWFDLACTLPHPGPELIDSVKCTPGTRSWVSALSPHFHCPWAQGVSQSRSTALHTWQPTRTYWDRAAFHVRCECQSPSGPIDKTGAHSWDLTSYLLVNKSLSPLRAENNRKLMIISTREVTGEDTESGYTEQACHSVQGLDSHTYIGHTLTHTSLPVRLRE